jgi:thiaminase/transcriptional activator TenA
MSEAGFSEWLRAQAGDTWTAAVDHRLFREIAADVVTDAVYERYLRIEFGFVDRAAIVLGWAVAKAPSFAERTHLAHGLHGLVTEQQDYFRAAFHSLGSDGTARSDGAEALHAVFGRTAEQGSFLDIMVCMLAAEWMYLTWCAAASHTPSIRPWIRNWVAMHAAGGFARHVAWMRSWIDLYAPADEPRRGALAELFRSALSAEIDFHDAAYR